jgi:hypothetical protein
MAERRWGSEGNPKIPVVCDVNAREQNRMILARGETAGESKV